VKYKTFYYARFTCILINSYLFFVKYSDYLINQKKSTLTKWLTNIKTGKEETKKIVNSNLYNVQEI